MTPPNISNNVLEGCIVTTLIPFYIKELFLLFVQLLRLSCVIMLYNLFYFNIFYLYVAEQKIDDVNIFKSLNNEELKELIPILGERKKFQAEMCTLVTSEIIISLTEIFESENISVFLILFYSKFYLYYIFVFYITKIIYR